MKRFGLGIVTLGLLLASAPALADRDPTPKEAHKVETALTAAGYKSWGKIHFDADVSRWRVDGAKAVDGKTYNLELNPTDYRIYSKPLD